MYKTICVYITNITSLIYTTNIYIGSDGEYLDLARYSVTSG